MSDLRQAAQQALDDLRDLHANHNITYAGTISRLEVALAQQAEPVEPNRWEGGHDIESPNNACMHKGYCMSLKQAREPMAQQAEPVAEFDHGIGADRFKVVRGAYWWHILIGDSPIRRGKFHTQAGAEEMVALLLREFRNGAFVQHNTAPPQRKPLTEEEIERICMTYQSPRQAARAIERAHGIGDNP